MLDRTKEPGALGEPLYLDVVGALRQADTAGWLKDTHTIRVIGGRVYGSGSEGYETERLAASATSDFKWAKAEGWLDRDHPDLWLRWATGKSVLGGLLGAYGCVEITKRLVGHKQPTGDAFAVIVPVGILLGRVGCYLNGCKLHS